MGKRWYGSVVNRICENKKFVPEIKVGTGATEYFYSDRHPYEVTRVYSQEHVFIRAMDAVAIGEPMSNEWSLISNPNKPERELKFLWGAWREVYKDKTGKTKYYKINISFGIAEKYYDYEI